jgi:hypothetical protein
MKSPKHLDKHQTTKITNSGPAPSSKADSIGSFSELTKATEDLFQKAKKTIKLYTHSLDPRVLNNRSIESQILQFIKRSRNSRLRILIYDENLLRGIDHRLVSLAQRFSSYIEIRVAPKEAHENLFAFYLSDDRTILLRRYSDRYEAQSLCLPSSSVQQKSKLFEKIWEQSSRASFLRALHL